MALLVECPSCRKRNGMKKSHCTCGHNIRKAAHKNYWIEYYLDGRRKRERIGPSKAAAEQRLRMVLKARAEERHIEKDKAVRVSFGEICNWYLSLPEVKAKRSFRRDQEFIYHLKRLLSESTKIKDLSPGRVETYQQRRLSEPSPRHPGEKIKPSTVNKEVSCLKTIFNRAVRHQKLDRNPIVGVRKLQENNVRMRILAQEEFERLLEASADHLRPIVLVAYYTGMRRSEIIELTWDEVDLIMGLVRLTADRTKTNTARSVPLHPRVRKMLTKMPRGLHTDRVFLMNGKPFNEMKNAFRSACKRAAIVDFTFHDLRHCANYRDADDNFLMGDNTYKLHLPKGIPAKNFWSVTAYHPDTRSLLQNGTPKPSISSYDKPDENPDGSVDVWFSPKAPNGEERNWIKTIPGEGWSILIRLYGPLEPYFDEGWKPDDIVKVN